MPLHLGIGDVRSRLVRLIPDTGAETQAIKGLFNYRLPRDYALARSEWLDIVEATHELWKGVSLPKQELIRSFLNVINLEVVKRLRPSSRFDWSGASIGNLFLTGYVTFESFTFIKGNKLQYKLTIEIEPVCSRAASSRQYIYCQVFAPSPGTCRSSRV
jgi:hypothetical protein